jgi:hypothetical protein
MVTGEDLAGGTDRVEGIAFAGAASWWAFGSAHLDDSFTVGGQELGQAGAVTVGSFHRPAACAGWPILSELEQLLVTVGVGRGFSGA